MAATMTLYCTRAKCFVDQSEGTKKFLLQAGPSPTPVPMWVAGTPTFKQGVKDKSIINLTPPHLMPDYVWPKSEEAETAALPEPTAVSVEEESAEQVVAPQAPFGGQPMTPVQTGPKLGVRASTRR